MLEYIFLAELADAYPNKLTSLQLYEAIYGQCFHLDDCHKRKQIRNLKKRARKRLLENFEDFKVDIEDFKSDGGGYKIKLLS
ncbi:MAG: hypothetical protein HRT47_01395 [Candidatus Caenarcaniphilales bacterium]|nr:hypothetical protein [Candidatus Caenarcaniphilales bacterium]